MADREKAVGTTGLEMKVAARYHSTLYYEYGLICPSVADIIVRLPPVGCFAYFPFRPLYFCV
jgi:hypothetical protein